MDLPIPLSGAQSAAWGPRHVLFGDGTCERVGPLLGELGVARGPVLLVSDRDVVRLGLAAGAEASLRAAGYAVDVFAEIAGEPDLATAERVAAAARAAPYGAVVGVGGGSAMDMAKVAAAMAVHAGPVMDIVGVNRVPRPTLPLVLVPTTAGTGAEASRNAMVIVDGRKAFISSPHLVPAAAVLDPLLTRTLPPRVTAATGLDALSHALEGYLSTYAGPLSSTAALAAARLIARWLEPAYHDGSDLPARRAMLHAAFLGGLALSASAVLGHSMAYTIANRKGLPHGVTCAMALPYCLAYCLPGAADRIAAAAAEVTLGEQRDPRWLVRWLGRLNERLGIPASLGEVGIGHEELPEMVDEVLTRYPRPNNPVPLERERLLRLYHHFHAGTLDECIAEMARR